MRDKQVLAVRLRRKVQALFLVLQDAPTPYQSLAHIGVQDQRQWARRRGSVVAGCVDQLGEERLAHRGEFRDIAAGQRRIAGPSAVPPCHIHGTADSRDRICPGRDAERLPGTPRPAWVAVGDPAVPTPVA